MTKDVISCFYFQAIILQFPTNSAGISLPVLSTKEEDGNSLPDFSKDSPDDIPLRDRRTEVELSPQQEALENASGSRQILP